MAYDPARIEPRWQEYWRQHQTFRTEEDPSRPKYYVLDMFPYPSGAGLHVGHPEGYTATDIIARYKRMRGFNVLHPMGWDAFGLPAERAAIRSGEHPAIITARNTANFRRQIERLGFSYDWSREIDTSSPLYYRWTQWIFLKLLEKGLAYREEVPVNWCPAQGTVLANEEVSPEGTYKETGDPVEKRMMKQWMLRITAYAQRLLDDLDDLDWPEAVKSMQREWIGRSEGAEVEFGIDGHDESFTVFTTRPDTLFGATYCVLAPEHPLVTKVTTDAQKEAVEDYVEAAGRKRDRDRIADTQTKTGVFTGAHAINPANEEKVPIWIADYVLAGYGTGAIMAVPAHDTRDFEFARAFDLPIVPVVAPREGALPDALAEAFTEDGIACNSGPYDGLETAAFKRQITADLEARGVARGKVQYALRDWLFSRQRYWGEPFPVVETEDGEIVPVGEEELPVTLPELEEFRPTEDGEPPLARARAWRETETADGRRALRETNTMPQWAGSCWYYLRYLDPLNEDAAWDPKKENYWMPVDLYVGGMEHAVLHLLYARFWHKVLFDLGLVSTKEPFRKLFNQGMILAWSYQDASLRYYSPEDVEERDGRWYARQGGAEVTRKVEKMSKSRLNVVNPDEVVNDFGADSLRLYEMFIGPLEASAPWQTEGLDGVHRFLHRTWRLFCDEEDRIATSVRDEEPDQEILKALHRTIDGVGNDIEGLRFNTAIAKMMELVNVLTKLERRPKAVLEPLLLILAPFAPHFCEELWEKLGHEDSLAHEPWPEVDPALLVDEQIVIPVSVKGKVRGRVEVAADADEETITTAALALESLKKHLGDKPPRRVIYVPGRMVNVIPG